MTEHQFIGKLVGMTPKLSRYALAALLSASGPNAKITGTQAERAELAAAGLATEAGNLTDLGRRTRRMAFEQMEDEAFG